MSIAMSQMKFPTAKPWWLYCKWAGWLILAVALLSGRPILWAIAAHWLCDFTLQGSQTAGGKAQRNLKVIAYHSFISGGFAGYIAGGLPGLIISVIIHFFIDWLYKPFLGDNIVTRIVDQALHITVIMLIVAYGGAV